MTLVTPAVEETLPPLSVARLRIAALQARLHQAGQTLRPPPPEPQTCCGRGCQGCVWEGFHDALAFWFEDAESLLAARPSSSPAPAP